MAADMLRVLLICLVIGGATGVSAEQSAQESGVQFGSVTGIGTSSLGTLDMRGSSDFGLNISVDQPVGSFFVGSRVELRSQARALEGAERSFGAPIDMRMRGGLDMGGGMIYATLGARVIDRETTGRLTPLAGVGIQINTQNRFFVGGEIVRQGGALDTTSDPSEAQTRVSVRSGLRF